MLISLSTNCSTQNTIYKNINKNVQSIYLSYFTYIMLNESYTCLGGSHAGKRYLTNKRKTQVKTTINPLLELFG